MKPIYALLLLPVFAVAIALAVTAAAVESNPAVTVLETILNLVMATAAVIAAIEAHGVERKIRTRQVRLDERDLINAEHGEPKQPFLIPVESNEQWKRYFELRSEGVRRKEAAEKVKEMNRDPSTDPRVAERL
jgi:hypothetical protein